MEKDVNGKRRKKRCKVRRRITKKHEYRKLFALLYVAADKLVHVR
jgi:hypothetical protein